MSSETLTFAAQLAHAHATVPDALPGAAFCALADGILALLFPQRAERPLPSADAVAAELHHFRAELAVLLNQVPNLPAPPSVLANEFGEAQGLHFNTLFALAFMLFCITFVVLAVAKLLIVRAEKAKGT